MTPTTDPALDAAIAAERAMTVAGMKLRAVASTNAHAIMVFLPAHGWSTLVEGLSPANAHGFAEVMNAWPALVSRMRAAEHEADRLRAAQRTRDEAEDGAIATLGSEAEIREAVNRQQAARIAALESDKDAALEALTSAIKSWQDATGCRVPPQATARIRALESALREACEYIDSGAAYCSDCNRGGHAHEWRDVLAGKATP